jgi:Adenosyl cobinamide kinase/adenosyl cobinamide phosphate guanylyltransferase
MNYYKQILGEINCRITEMADEVTEVVSGMAQKIKGKTNVSGRKSFAPGIKLIIGGEYQGKRAFATKRYGIGSLEDGASCSKETLYGCEGIYHFEIFIKRMMDERENISIILDKIIEENPEIVIISTEIGMGLVPINKVERLYREQVGRICTELAKKAVCVTRVICGIGITLKEEEIEG